MIKTDSDVKSTLRYFSVDVNALYLESKNIQIPLKKSDIEETLIQGNIILLMEQAHKVTKKIRIIKKLIVILFF